MLVAPTSTSRAPLRAITSGTRKEPPISTSSPREMATPMPGVRADSMSSTAAALLFTAKAPSAPVSSLSSSSTRPVRLPRLPADRSYSRLE